ncbi:MAG: GDSL family lipase [Clostridia bacterium]|nr:GDSL family lipase [Clostridia bacterium]
MRILFQGDSITDAGRDRSDPHELGQGYPLYTAGFLCKDFPTTAFEFLNLGISGDQTKQLVERLQADFIDVDPDIVSIHIGINDTWHRAETRDWLPGDVFEAQYRTVLEAIKANTHAKILIIEQFLLPVEDKAFFREDLNGKIDITRKLARAYADAYLPLDGLLAKACVGQSPYHWSADGVHPNDNGSAFIGRLCADAFAELL